MNDLLDTFAHRAGQAPTATDDLLHDAQQQGRELIRRRRTLTALAGGSGAVVAAVALLMVTSSVLSGPSSSPDRTADRVGRVPAAASSAGVASSATKSAPSTASTLAPLPLETVTPAPRSAPVSVSLAPMGWRYLGHTNAITVYAVEGSTGPPAADFENRIVVGPHEAIGPQPLRDFPLRVAQRPANYADNQDGYQFVSIRYSTTISIDFQIPPTGGLNRAQVLRMADTVDIRDVSNPTHG